VEIKSLNNRYLVIKSRLPEGLARFEPRIQEVLRKGIRRGSVDLSIRTRRTGQSQPNRINREVLDGYIEAVKRIRKKERLGGEVVPEHLLGLPGVVVLEEDQEVTEKQFALVDEAVRAALELLKKMRASEGKRLIRGMVRRRKLLGRVVQGVEKKAGRSSRDRQARLKARLDEILDGDKFSADDPALQREIAVLADRSDITEELDRLRSHLAQFDRVIASDDEIGRQLDFLIQEMGREVNTIGSKAGSAAISHDVVKMKAELEKIREQVQNIE
jgi:uncharacterized protein (TIGR00255 family)